MSLPVFELSDTPIPDETIHLDPNPEILVQRDDGKVECPECKGHFTLTKAGTVRSHKCDGERPTAVARVKGSAPKRKGRKAPGNVRKFGVAIGATAAETASAYVIGRTIPCDPSLVPTNLPDPEAMVGPFIDYLWPQLPAKAQNVVTAIVDQEDLITAAFLWWEWWRNLNAWAKRERDIRRPDTEGTTDEPLHGTTLQGFDGHGTFEAFAPSGETM